VSRCRPSRGRWRVWCALVPRARTTLRAGTQPVMVLWRRPFLNYSRSAASASTSGRRVCAGRERRSRRSGSLTAVTPAHRRGSRAADDAGGALRARTAPALLPRYWAEVKATGWSGCRARLPLPRFPRSASSGQDVQGAPGSGSSERRGGRGGADSSGVAPAQRGGRSGHGSSPGGSGRGRPPSSWQRQLADADPGNVGAHTRTAGPCSRRSPGPGAHSARIAEGMEDAVPSAFTGGPGGRPGRPCRRSIWDSRSKAARAEG